MPNDTIPTFAEFRAYLQEMEGFELNTLGEGEMAVLRADDDSMTLALSPRDTHEVAYLALAPWFDKLLVQRFLAISMLEDDFAIATPLVAALFLQLDGMRYEADTETLFWFDA